jgi:DNA mismatch repair protein MutL
MSTGDFQLFNELHDELNQLGFDVSEFGKNTVIINGLPSELSKTDGADTVQQILDDYKTDLQEVKLDKTEVLKRATAKNAAIKAGTKLSEPVMRQLVTDLLQCKQYNVNPKGAAITIKFDEQSLERFFHHPTK